MEPSAEEAVVTFIEGIRPGGGGGGNHSINVHNEEDGRVKIKGSIQLNTITTSNVAPRNSARGWSSCVDCRTLAVAIQINIIDRDATRVAPQNVALAINYQCSHCATVAIALQYTLSVDDPRETPREVEELVRALDKELRRAAHEEDLPAAIAGIEAVIAAYQELREDLDDERDQATETTSPGAVDETPPPSASPSASGSPVSSESSSASASAAASATPSPAPSVGADPSPSVGASPPP